MLTLVESNLHGFPIARHGFVAYNGLDSGEFREEDALVPAARFMWWLVLPAAG